jgi:hypothetical protein
VGGYARTSKVIPFVVDDVIAEQTVGFLCESLVPLASIDIETLIDLVSPQHSSINTRDTVVLTQCNIKIWPKLARPLHEVIEVVVCQPGI